MSTMMIDVFHDTVCPWCRIGKRHLALALEGWDGPVEVRYHAFYLNPAIPPDGHDFRSTMIAKGGGRVPLEGFFDGPRRAGEAVGLHFDFEAITRAPNSTLSHQLIVNTPQNARPAMIDAVYQAYFADGKDIGDVNVLADIAAAQGQDRAAAHQALLDGVGRDVVDAQVQMAQQLGISGVPFFVFNNALAFSGAQPPHVIRQVMQQAAQHTQEA